MQNYTRDRLENSFRDEIFVGLDVDKASISVTVRDKYTTLKSLKMPYDSKKLNCVRYTIEYMQATV